jgi:hypothetical protein
MKILTIGHHWYPQHRRQIFLLFATGVVDTGGKFTSRFNDCIPVANLPVEMLTAEENLPLVSATPAVSTTPVANNRNNII